MITRNQVVTAVTGAIAELFGAAPGTSVHAPEIALDASLDSFGIDDSLGLVEVSMNVEERLCVDITGNSFDPDGIATVRDLVNAICVELDI